MFQKQPNNFFGFSGSNFEPTNFEKTATFFNPYKKEGESSFSTQGTDITRENSSQSTPPQNSKGDDLQPCKLIRAKRVPLINTKKPSQQESLDSPSLIFQQSPPLDHQSRDKSISNLRNCLSQERTRLPLDLYGEAFDLNVPEEYKSTTPIANTRFQSRHESLPQISDQTDQLFESSEAEPFGNSSPNAGPSNVFRIRTQSKNKGRVTKFNKIRVISVIPTMDNITLPSLPTIKRFVTDQKLVQRNRERESPLRIHDLEPKALIIDYAMTSDAKSQISFDFVEKLGSHTKKLSAISPNPQEIMDRFKRSIITKDRSAITEPFEKSSILECTRDRRDIKSPTNLLETGTTSTKKYLPEKVRVIDACREIDAGMVLSHNEQKGNGQKRISLKFKNEQVLLNKLFDPSKQRKKV